MLSRNVVKQRKSASSARFKPLRLVLCANELDFSIVQQNAGEQSNRFGSLIRIPAERIGQFLVSISCNHLKQ